MRVLFLCSLISSKQCTIKSSRSNLSYSMALKYACSKCMQMSLVDVFVIGGAGESNQWEDITTKALSLDRDDFLPTRYKVSAKFKIVASTPPRLRAGPRPSDQSQPSPAKKRKTAVVKEVLNLSDDDTDDKDYHVSEEGDQEEEDDKEEKG